MQKAFFCSVQALSEFLGMLCRLPPSSSVMRIAGITDLKHSRNQSLIIRVPEAGKEVIAAGLAAEIFKIRS